MSPNKSMVSVRVPGAPDFGPSIEKLLKVGGVTSTADARSSLDSNLQLAWVESRRREQAPKGYFTQLEDSIEKTQRLLRRLAKFRSTRDIGFDVCPVGDGGPVGDGCPGGDGMIAVVTAREMVLGKPVELPRNPPQLPPGGDRFATDLVAAINRERVLDRLLREVARLKPKRKRGNQEERDKLVIVARAASFFREYSTVEPTTYFDGPFVKFCKGFYKLVTGETLGESGLVAAIRREVAKPSLPHFRNGKA
jgi:hypothetical protein